MNEYEVVFHGSKRRCFVTADWWEEKDGTVYFWTGSTIASFFTGVFSVKISKRDVHLIDEEKQT